MKDILCPVCEQDYIFKARIKPTGEVVLVCPECFSVWLPETYLRFDTHEGYKSFMRKRGLDDKWDFIVPVE
jgi:Zn-finger nucleic acid-binding protein